MKRFCTLLFCLAAFFAGCDNSEKKDESSIGRVDLLGQWSLLRYYVNDVEGDMDAWDHALFPSLYVFYDNGTAESGAYPDIEIVNWSLMGEILRIVRPNGSELSRMVTGQSETILELNFTSGSDNYRGVYEKFIKD